MNKKKEKNGFKYMQAKQQITISFSCRSHLKFVLFFSLHWIILLVFVGSSSSVCFSSGGHEHGWCVDTMQICRFFKSCWLCVFSKSIGHISHVIENVQRNKKNKKTDYFWLGYKNLSVVRNLTRWDWNENDHLW